MLSIPPTVRIYLATTPTDMRKSHDGLAAIVEHGLKADPLSGHLFVFRNKRADRIKVIYWDRDGYALWYKRLEAGRVNFPAVAEGVAQVTITATEWAMLLGGVELSSVRRHKRFKLPGNSADSAPSS